MSIKVPVSLKPFLAVVLAAIIFILSFFYVKTQIQKNYKNTEPARLSNKSQSQELSPGLPVRLEIPSIAVNSFVQNVGVTPAGVMGVPSNTVDVGWFDIGPRPGEPGNSVFAGHFDGEHGEAGVFRNLYKLKPGDQIYVEDAQSETTTFVVRDSKLYDPGYAADVFNSSKGIHLSLITCDGVWNGVVKSYSKRLVVFADIVN